MQVFLKTKSAAAAAAETVRRCEYATEAAPATRLIATNVGS